MTGFASSTTARRQPFRTLERKNRRTMPTQRRTWSKPRPPRQGPWTTRYLFNLNQRSGLAPRLSSFRTTKSCCSQQEIKTRFLWLRSPRPHCGLGYWRTAMRRSQLKASVHRPRIGRKRPPREADVEQVVSTDNSNSKREKPARDHSDLAFHCEAVARIVWGKPSSETATELRWGMHGSRVVNRAKGIWFDHEHGIGGGTLDLVPRATKNNRLQWLCDHGLINKASSGPRKKRSGGRASFTIVATYDYADESGAPLFQVVRLVPKDFRQRRPNGTGGSAKHAACCIGCQSCGTRSLAAAWCLSWRARRMRTIYASSGS